jgi:riboflavin biosynthesis pyrimidine reductase
MISSIDGRILPSRWTRSPDGSREDWSASYAAVHEKHDGDAWIVGRVTMAEMTRAAPHAPAVYPIPERPRHFTARDAKAYAIAIDPSGKLHFDRPDVEGDAAVVLLGRDVPNEHLAELAADGISYIVSETEEIDFAVMLDALGSELGIQRLILEGGGVINGRFFTAGLVDELGVLIAPALDGRSDSRGIVEFAEVGTAGETRLSLISCERLDHGLVHLRYAIRRD